MSKEALEAYFLQNVKVPVYDWLIGNYWQQQELLEGTGKKKHKVMFPRAFAEHFLARSEVTNKEELLEQLGAAAVVPGELDEQHNISMNFSYGENFSAATKEWCNGGNE